MAGGSVETRPSLRCHSDVSVVDEAASYAISIGQSVLKFLKGTPNDGLLFGPATGTLGSCEELTRPVTERSLTAFSDALFVPGMIATPVGSQQAHFDVSVYGRKRADQCCERCSDWSGCGSFD